MRRNRGGETCSHRPTADAETAEICISAPSLPMHAPLPRLSTADRERNTP